MVKLIKNIMSHFATRKCGCDNGIVYGIKEECDLTGMVAYHNPRKCQKCNGTGEVNKSR